MPAENHKAKTSYPPLSTHDNRLGLACQTTLLKGKGLAIFPRQPHPRAMAFRLPPKEDCPEFRTSEGRKHHFLRLECAKSRASLHKKSWQSRTKRYSLSSERSIFPTTIRTRSAMFLAPTFFIMLAR